MGAPKVSDADFVAAWRQAGGSPKLTADLTGLSQGAVYKRRARMAKDRIVLPTVPMDGRRGANVEWLGANVHIPQRLELNVREGVVIVFSDAHYWPDKVTVAHRALLSVIRDLKPVLIIANGDILDGATISRHDRNGWEQRPTLKQEVDACKERMDEIEQAAGVDCRTVWNFGNHDTRFERVLATQAPQFEGLLGTTLADHFPRWQFSMSTMLNPREPHPVMVKHRFRAGVHAAYNNTVNAGISIVTGHVHRLNVTCWGDYRGRRYGIDTGTLAEPCGPQFAYGEDDPKPHGSGFAVLTFEDSELLPPEICEVRGDDAYFRGKRVAL